jgi:drug/metabolite transporter (DMT)-like permease
MFQELTQYLVDHPIILTSLGIFVLLAVIGGWYVVSHHLHAVLVTLLCAAGFVSGILVFYRGFQNDLEDLQIIGAFLIVIFPLVYHQAIHLAKIAFGGEPSATAKGHARRAGA